jgi:hypothetical protein
MAIVRWPAQAGVSGFGGSFARGYLLSRQQDLRVRRGASCGPASLSTTIAGPT